MRSQTDLVPGDNTIGDVVTGSSWERLSDSMQQARAGDTTNLVELVSDQLWRLLDEAPAEMVAAFGLLPDNVDLPGAGTPILRSLCRSMSVRVAVFGGGDRPAIEIDENPVKRAALHLERMLRLRMAQKLESAQELADGLRETLSSVDEQTRAEFGPSLGVIFIHTGITSLLNGDSLAAQADFSMARLFGIEDGSRVITYDATCKSAITLALRGGLEDAQRQLSSVSGEITGPLVRFTHGSETIAKSLIAVEQVAPTALETLTAIEDADPINELWPLALLAKCRWALYTGSCSEALELLSLARAQHGGVLSGLAKEVEIAIAVEAYCRMNLLTAAVDMLIGATTDSVLIEPVRCRLLIRLDELDAAHGALNRLLTDPDSASAARDGAQIALAWIQLLADGEVQQSVAAAIYDSVVRGGRVRALTEVPERVSRAVAESLGEIRGAALLSRIDGLVFISDVPRATRLSDRELDVLRVLRKQNTIADVAAELFVSPNTIKTQLASIYRKLGVHNKTKAVRVAERLGLIR